ncbi:VRR-NUC endonuclease domain-containing protein [Rhizobium phage RHph_X2_30]|nr:VRR-NUC endonuclease domain-containing protein [Rhizobium phage RHph_X2_30]
MAEIPHVQNPIMDYARSQDWLARRMRYLGRVGCPDTFFFKAGVILIMEFKDEGKEPNEMQKREHARLRRRGIVVHVVDNVAEGMRILDAHDPDAI